MARKSLGHPLQLTLDAKHSRVDEEVTCLIKYSIHRPQPLRGIDCSSQLLRLSIQRLLCSQSPSEFHLVQLHPAGTGRLHLLNDGQRLVVLLDNLARVGVEDTYDTVRQRVCDEALVAGREDEGAGYRFRLVRRWAMAEGKGKRSLATYIKLVLHSCRLTFLKAKRSVDALYSHSPPLESGFS